jgi:hypothetical protein
MGRIEQWDISFGLRQLQDIGAMALAFLISAPCLGRAFWRGLSLSLFSVVPWIRQVRSRAAEL